MSLQAERNFDINSLSNINTHVNNLGEMYFVVTGSYAIEALSGKELKHNDLDSNIFTTDLVKDLPRVATLIENGTTVSNAHLVRESDDRLEYDIESGQNSLRRLEIQFVQFTKKEDYIPTTLAKLKDATGKEFIFRFKSLSYTIATWAIRVSGLAINTKRSLMERDIEGFRLLVANGYDNAAVLQVMKLHSQMPKDISEEEVLRKALQAISKGE